LLLFAMCLSVGGAVLGVFLAQRTTNSIVAIVFGVMREGSLA
jgi:hypothetical protein